MKTRVIAGLCMVPLLAIIYFGGIALATAGLSIATIGVKEFYNGWGNIGVRPCKTLAYIMATALFSLYFLFVKFYEGQSELPLATFRFLIIWILVSIVASLIYGWKIDKRGPYDAIATMTGLLYVVLFSFHLVLLDSLKTGYIFIWIVVIAAFGSDIFAYFTGMLLGKHKLAPNLSPKKTVEGSVGGAIGAGILCLIFAIIFIKEYIWQAALIGVIGGLISQAGDLTASAFKRKMGIKDYGKLIPGHGGILDRFDSVIFLAPFVYYYVLFVIEIPTLK